MRDLILASGSPRRKDIMEFLGVPFRIQVSDFPEEDVRWDDFDDPREFVSAIAMGKALTVAAENSDSLILSADTSVFLGNQNYGKPTDLNDARRILKALRGKRHSVTTGVVIYDSLTKEHDIATSTSFVEFLPFSDQQLEKYIDTSESLGKAGAYAIQMGAQEFVKNVQGSVSNIVGLPIEETVSLLESFNIPVDVDVEALIDEHFTFRQ